LFARVNFADRYCLKEGSSHAVKIGTKKVMPNLFQHDLLH
jgi:hypothetical protein